MRIYLIFFAIIILFVIGSCSKLPETTQVDVPFTFTDSNGKSPFSWNKALKLKLPANIPDAGKIGSDIILEIDNISDNQIQFPADRNVKIYDKTNGMKELKNRVTYIPNDHDLIIGPFKEYKDGFNFVGFIPEIQSDTEIKIRVYVIGEMLYDDPAKNEPVGAYMDLVLHP